MQAITSTSTKAPLGRPFTTTQLLAVAEVMYFSYTWLNAAKSEISDKKQGLYHVVKGCA